MLTLIGLLPSPFVRKVCVVLAEKGIEYTMRVQGATWPNTCVPDFNPLGKIPVLAVEGAPPLFDSPVIVEYLDGLKPEPRLIPEAFEARIAVRRWEALSDGIYDAATGIMGENRRAENERSPSYITRQFGKIERAITEMARALGDRKYLCGETITLADLAAGVALSYVDYRLPTVEWRGKYPALAHFADALEQRPSFRCSNNDPSREAPDRA
jgi:glutathione S-transferase